MGWWSKGASLILFLLVAKKRELRSSGETLLLHGKIRDRLLSLQQIPNVLIVSDKLLIANGMVEV